MLIQSQCIKFKNKMKLLPVLILIFNCSLANFQLIEPLNILSSILDRIPSGNLTADNDELLAFLAQQYLTSKYSDLIHSIDEFPENECIVQLRSYAHGLRNFEDWAMQMFDATAKPQSGLLMGNIVHLGNYDQCLKIRHEIRGKYCLAQYTFESSFGLDANASLSKVEKFTEDLRQSYGLCIPSACTAENLQEIFRLISNVTPLPISFSFDDKFCDDGEPIPFTTGAIWTLIIFGCCGLIVAISTGLDILFHKKNDGKQIKFYSAFSLYSNTKKLLSTKTSEENLNCLNGLRVISMMWILLAHKFMFSIFMPIINSMMIPTEWMKSSKNSLILGASMAVDTFFTISGLLVVYLFMKNREKGGRFSLPLFYLHRILRLTPSLVTVILFTSTLTRYLGRGPFWAMVVDVFQTSCEKNWWVTLLYLQNYINEEEACVGQSWYLAVDTQLYFLSPLLFFPLIKWPKAVFTASLGVIILVACNAFLVTWNRNLGSVFFDQDPEYLSHLYYPTHVRISPWLIGGLFGYLLYKNRNKKLHLEKFTAVVIWILSVGVLLGIVMMHITFVKYEYNVLRSSIFNSISKPLWAVALCVVIYLCTNGYGGFINTFLSSKAFLVLIRINYNMYLLHTFEMIFFLGQQMTPGYVNNKVVIHEFWGDFIYTGLWAFVWTLFFESPILVLEKMIFGNGKGKINRNSITPKNDSTQLQIGIRKLKTNNSDVIITLNSALNSK